MGTTNLNLTELAGTEKLKVFPPVFNADIEAIDAAFGAAYGGVNDSVADKFTAVDTNIDNAKGQIVVTANGDTHAQIPRERYVSVKNKSGLTNGIYRTKTAIAQNGSLSSSNLDSVSKGALNDFISTFKKMVWSEGEAVAIPANSDLNNYLTPGVFYIANTTDYGTILHTPPGHNWQSRLIVFPTATYAGTLGNGGQIMWSNNGYVSYRTILYSDNNQTWTFGDWVRLNNQMEEFNTLTAVTLNFTASSDSYFYETGRNIYIMVVSNEAVSWSNGTTIGSVTTAYRPGKYAVFPVFEFDSGRPINGSIWVSNGSLMYYGDTISSKKIAFNANWMR